MLLATVAVTIWAGNFVIARGVNGQIPPITLAFCRWSLATILMIPIAYKSFKTEWHILKKHKGVRVNVRDENYIYKIVEIRLEGC